MTSAQQPPIGANAPEVTDAVTAAILAGAGVATITAAVGALGGISNALLRTIFTDRGFAAFITDAVEQAPAPLPGGAGDTARKRVEHLAGEQQTRARAAYLTTATVRLAKAYATGDADTIARAKEREDKLYRAHTDAITHRDEQTKHLLAAVDGATPDADGRVLLGWHADDSSNQCARCAAADGKNFDALKPPPIGWPGHVHPHCYCKAGVPFPRGGSVDDVDPNLRDASGLQFGKGSKLWTYWTVGKGVARYLGKPHPWTALRDALISEGVPATQADGLATNIMMATPAGRAAFKAHHQGGKGRSEMKPETRNAPVGDAITEFRAPSDDAPDKPYGFTARAVNYGVADSYNTSWQRGVFRDSLEGRMPSVVWGHNWNDPIGRVVGYRDGEDGLDIDVELDDFEAVPRARQAYAQLRSGTMSQFSFAFKRAEEKPDPAIRGCTRITKAGLDEFSVVLNGAVPGTHVTGIRSADALRSAGARLSELADGNRSDFAEELGNVIDTLKGLMDPDESAEDAALDGLGLDDTEDPEVLRMTADTELRERLASGGQRRGSAAGARFRASMPAKPYGDVKYADPGYQDDKKKRYPLDTKEHVQAALSYIGQKRNAAQYSPEQLAKVKAAINAAAKKFGIGQ